MNAWILTGFGLNVAMIVMAIAWVIARRLRNVSFLDVAASLGFAIVVCSYAAIGAGDPARKWLIAGMVTIWSLRLASLLLIDVLRQHPQEGQRYLALREHFPKRPWLMFFGFSQYLAALRHLALGTLCHHLFEPSSRTGSRGDRRINPLAFRNLRRGIG